MKWLSILLLSTFTPLLQAAPPAVYVLTVEGVINPVTHAYIEEGIIAAEKNSAHVVVLELDTPGGLLEATRSINSSIINSKLPVIVYVSPRGARATSAGVFITMAADVAAMSPETHIGAAHPVTITGDSPGSPPKKQEKGNSDVMSEKMVSDAAAYIRTLASERGRNAEWAEKAVRESVSLTSEEAVNQNVVEILSPSLQDLLEKVDGRTLQKNGRKIKLETKNSPPTYFPMSRTKKFLHKLAHPNVAYILMTIGIYGLIYELATPGIGLGGGVGVICLLLAFFSLQVLPINTVGVALIVLGFTLLLLEHMAPSHGLLLLSGLCAFGLGSFMLIDTQSHPEVGRVSLELILSTVGATALFFGFAIRKAFQARRLKPRTGRDLLIGAKGITKTALDPQGMVFVEGELWTAKASEFIDSDKAITVTGIEGNTLFVKISE